MIRATPVLFPALCSPPPVFSLALLTEHEHFPPMSGLNLTAAQSSNKPHGELPESTGPALHPEGGTRQPGEHSGFPCSVQLAVRPRGPAGSDLWPLRCVCSGGQQLFIQWLLSSFPLPWGMIRAIILNP